MSVTLTQSEAAGFPDRGRVGLRATVSPGGGGSCLTHETEAPLAVWHVRWLMHYTPLTGGPVVVAAGFDDDGAQTWRATLDPDAQQIAIELATGQSLTAELPAALAWHAIELGVDTLAGEAGLWINGVARDGLGGSLQALATRAFWLGAALAHSDAAGELHLDEWRIADGYIGPVRTEPASDFADDPARWLVVYNTAVADSIIWAGQYRAARGLPWANLLGLDLPVSEIISAMQFADFRDAVEHYLSHNGLADQIMGVLVGYAVPGYVDFTGTGPLCAVDDLLHTSHTTAGVVFNSLAADALPARPTHAALAGRRLTARLDGPSLEAAQTLTQRAIALRQDDPGDGGDATLLLDPFAGSGPLFDTVTGRLLDWAQSVDRQRLRLPVQISGPLDSTAPQQFEAIHSDGFFWGWGQPTPPAGFFADPPGRRMVCVQFDVTSATAVSARDGASNWIGAPLAAGYAAAVAASRIISVSSVPYARPFFEALRRGWTLAEAMYLAKPVLRDGLYLVGDPLLRVNLPRAGWEVFGPLESLERLDPSQPLAALRVEETSLTVPPAGGWYVVRGVDAQGRPEQGLALVSVVQDAGAALRPILPPVWPSGADWPVRVRAGQIELVIAWDRAISAAGVESIELHGEVNGGDPVTLATAMFSPHVRFVRLHRAMPEVSVRFCWRVTSNDGAMWLSPWSVVVTPQTSLDEPLHILEANA